MLQTHVLNFYGDKGAVGQGLLQGRGGVVGVDVDLDDLVVIHQHQAVAQLLEEGPQFLRVPSGLPGDDEFCAVGEGNVLGVEVREIGLLLGGFLLDVFRDGHVLSPQGQEHGF